MSDIKQAVWTESGWALKLRCGHMAMTPHETTCVKADSGHYAPGGKVYYAAPPKEVDCGQCTAAEHLRDVKSPSRRNRGFTQPVRDLGLGMAAAYGVPPFGGGISLWRLQ